MEHGLEIMTELAYNERDIKTYDENVISVKFPDQNSVLILN